MGQCNGKILAKNGLNFTRLFARGPYFFQKKQSFAHLEELTELHCNKNT